DCFGTLNISCLPWGRVYVRPAGRRNFEGSSPRQPIVGSLGANQLLEETIPGQSDTLRTQYDALGRQVGHDMPLGTRTWAKQARRAASNWKAAASARRIGTKTTATTAG
ncbi:hypothetical protein, partial [Ralstonia pseudosolanacearum]|uniref:hypothetical protein n=1 Tax=Ralstonia pseudosolanacearum TaxID=1310165 RepID=UPI001FFA2018